MRHELAGLSDSENVDQFKGKARRQTVALLQSLIDRIECWEVTVIEATETRETMSYHRDGDAFVSASPSGWRTLSIRYCHTDENAKARAILSDPTVTQVHDEA